MHIHINKQMFKQAIRQPVKLAKTRTSFAVLQNIKLEGKDGKLIVTGTDMDTSICVSVSGTVHEEGIVLVDAATLDNVTSAHSDEIIISADNESVTVKSEKVKHTLPKGDISDFPSIEFISGKNDCEISGSNLCWLCRKTAYSISKDESRKDFTGALLSVKDGMAQMVATDGHRLSKAECEATGVLDGCIVPAKAIKILSELTGIIKLHSSKGKIHVMTDDGVQMSISLVAGRFPDFTRVFPTCFDTKVTIDVKSFRDMLKSVAIATEQSGNVHIKISEDMLALSANNNKCKASAEIPVEVDGKTVSFGINGEYLLQTIDAICEPRVSIGIVDADSPILVTGVNNSESNQHIVMPMIV